MHWFLLSKVVRATAYYYCSWWVFSIAMEGSVSKRVAALPHWAAGLPAVIWVQQDALGLSCKNSNWWWMQTPCENNFVHWTYAKQPTVFTNPWHIFSAVLSLLLCSLPSEARRKTVYVWQYGTCGMGWGKVGISLRLCYVSVLQSELELTSETSGDFCLVCYVFRIKHRMNLVFSGKPCCKCFTVVILKSYYFFFTW